MNVDSEHSQAIENPNGLNSDTVSRRLFLKICTAFSGALAVATSSFRHAEGISKTVGGNPEVVGSRVEREKTRLVNEILKKVTIYDTGIIGENGEILPVEETEIFQRLTKWAIEPEELTELQQNYQSDSNQLFEDDPMTWVALFLMPGKHDHGKQVVDLLKKHVAALAQVAETNIKNPTFVSIGNAVESDEQPIKQYQREREITKTLEHRGETSKVQYKAQIFNVTTGDAASIEKLDNLPKLVSLSGQIGTVQVEVLTHERVPLSRQITPADIRRAINHNFDDQKFDHITFDKDLGFFDFKGQVVNLEDIQSYELTYSSPNGENDKTVTFSNDLKEIAVGKDEFLSESGGGEWAPRVTQIVIRMKNDDQYVSKIEDTSSTITVITEQNDDAANDEESTSGVESQLLAEEMIWKKLSEPDAHIIGAYNPANPNRVANLEKIRSIANQHPDTTFVLALGNYGDTFSKGEKLPDNVKLVGQLLPSEKPDSASTLNKTGGIRAVWVRLSDWFREKDIKFGSSFATPLFAFAMAGALEGDESWTPMVDQMLDDGTIVRKLDLSALQQKITETAVQKVMEALTITRRAFLGARHRN